MALPKKLSQRQGAVHRQVPNRVRNVFGFGTLSHGKVPEELEPGNNEEIVSVVVLPGLVEADEAEAAAWGSADREVAGHEIVIQVIVLARVNNRP